MPCPNCIIDSVASSPGIPRVPDAALCHTALLSTVLFVVLMLFVETQVWELLNSTGKTKLDELYLLRTLDCRILRKYCPANFSSVQLSTGSLLQYCSNI